MCVRVRPVLCRRIELGTYCVLSSRHDRLDQARGEGGLAQLEERVVRNDEAPGSKPGFSTGLPAVCVCCLKLSI